MGISCDLAADRNRHRLDRFSHAPAIQIFSGNTLAQDRLTSSEPADVSVVFGDGGQNQFSMFHALGRDQPVGNLSDLF